jgi:hypothetical protein
MLTVGVLACISHGKSAGSGMLKLAEADVRVENISMITRHLQVLILEAVAVNGLKNLCE